ncbi:MAG: RHS repeat-associated core domain-containing protein, partial [Christensenellaceae bacterium]|nr:RHS repeat-associated core domain-containing protein [Christensenellaceae bacterium]
GICNEYGNMVEYTYDAWGRPTGMTGTLTTTLGMLNPFRYRGYVWDEEMGLYYLRSRYYNPEWGRFINPDRGLDAHANVLDLNVFCYCKNMWIHVCDPSGQSFEWADLPYPGVIHKAVQIHICAVNIGILQEVDVLTEENGQINKGRIDLFRPHTGEIWEVKPSTVGVPLAKMQLNKYLGGRIVGYHGSVVRGVSIPSGQFYVPILDDTYHVEYSSPAKGVVTYKFSKVQRMRVPEYSYVFQPSWRSRDIKVSDLVYVAMVLVWIASGGTTPMPAVA